MQRKRAGADTEKDCGVSPEVESNTRWSSFWRQAVKEQRCLDNCDALLITAEHLTVGSPHTHASIMNRILWMCSIKRNYHYTNNKISGNSALLFSAVNIGVSSLSSRSFQRCNASALAKRASEHPAVWNAERISSSRPAICSPEPPAWDRINMATVDGECGRHGLSLSLSHRLE